MSERENINRREFLQKSVLKAGSVALAGGIVGSDVHSAILNSPLPAATSRWAKTDSILEPRTLRKTARIALYFQQLSQRGEQFLLSRQI